MPTDRRQIFAFSGMLQSESDRGTNFDLTCHALSLSGKEQGQRVCYVPTAVGDSQSASDAKTTQFAEQRPDLDFSVLRPFNQPNVPDVREHPAVAARAARRGWQRGEPDGGVARARPAAHPA